MLRHLRSSKRAGIFVPPTRERPPHDGRNITTLGGGDPNSDPHAPSGLRYYSPPGGAAYRRPTPMFLRNCPRRSREPLGTSSPPLRMCCIYSSAGRRPARSRCSGQPRTCEEVRPRRRSMRSCLGSILGDLRCRAALEPDAAGRCPVPSTNSFPPLNSASSFPHCTVPYERCARLSRRQICKLLPER